MNQVVPYAQAVPAAAPSLVPQNLTVAMELARMMAGAALVPAHLQDKPADCLLVIEQAVRWGMSPFAVAQATSVISGKLMYEGKLVAAAINSSGILSKRLSYVFTGEGVNRTVKVLGTIRGEDEARDVQVVFKDVKTNNSMWTKQIDQQLTYSGARVWARRHLPEVMLGVYSPDEFDEAPRTAPTSLSPPSAPPAPAVDAPVPLTEEQWLDRLLAAETKDELLKIGADIEAALPTEAVDRLLPTFKARMKALKAKPAGETIYIPESRQGREPLPKHDPETGEFTDEAALPEHMRSEHDMAAEAPAPEGDAPLQDSEAWRDEMLALLAAAKSARAIDTLVATRIETVRGKHFPGDSSAVDRAVEKARQRVSKAQ